MEESSLYDPDSDTMCQFCALDLLSTKELQKHVLKEHSGKFTCTYCELIFGYRKTWKTHMKVEHEGKRSSCMFCASTFRREYDLKVHTKNLHTNPPTRKTRETKQKTREKKQKLVPRCKYCSKQLCNLQTLRRHLKSHKLPSSNDCKFCDEKFTSRGFLGGHMRKVHPKIGEHYSRLGKPKFLPYEKFAYKSCQFCKDKFDTALSLSTHKKRKHTEKFKTKLRENLIHPKDPSTKFFNAECKICAEKFSSQYQLLHHMKKAHADMEGPAPCQYCDQVFPSTYLRTPHMRTVHPGMKTKHLRQLQESGKFVQGQSDIKVTNSKVQHRFTKLISEEESIDDPSVENAEVQNEGYKSPVEDQIEEDCITEEENSIREEEGSITEVVENITKHKDDIIGQEMDITVQEDNITKQGNIITEQEECTTEQEEAFAEQEDAFSEQKDSITAHEQGDITEQEEEDTEQEENETEKEEDDTEQGENETEQEEDETERGENETEQEVCMTYQNEELGEDITKQKEEIIKQEDYEYTSLYENQANHEESCNISLEFSKQDTEENIEQQIQNIINEITNTNDDIKFIVQEDGFLESSDNVGITKEENSMTEDCVQNGDSVKYQKFELQTVTISTKVDDEYVEKNELSLDKMQGKIEALKKIPPKSRTLDQQKTLKSMQSKVSVVKYAYKKGTLELDRIQNEVNVLKAIPIETRSFDQKKKMRFLGRKCSEMKGALGVQKSPPCKATSVDYQCNFCGLKYDRKQSFHNHMRNIHTSPDIFCENCNYSTKNNDNFKNHKKMHDNKSDREASLGSDDTQLTTQQTGMQATHNLEVSDRQHEIKNENIESQNEEQSLLLQFSCDYCKYRTSKKDHLNRHVASIHMGIRFSCDICDLNLKSKDAVRKHKTRIHENPHNRTMFCQECDYSTTNKEKLRQHGKSLHGKPIQRYIMKNHICEICSFKTYCKSKLDFHVNSTHLGFKIKKLKCSRCNFKTSSQSKLESHLNSKHLEVK